MSTDQIDQPDGSGWVWDKSDNPADSVEIDGLEIIGSGTQYTVYDLGNGRVRKVPLEYEESVNVVDSWYDSPQTDTPEVVRQLLDQRNAGAIYVENTIAQNPSSAGFFGNPVFRENGIIEQDKMDSVSTLFDDARNKESLIMAVGLSVDAIKTAWSYGVCDTVFNMVKNYGLTSAGKVAMKDFGQISTDLGYARHVVDNQAWRESGDFLRVLTDEQKQAFSIVAEASMSLQELERTWRTQGGGDMSNPETKGGEPDFLGGGAQYRVYDLGDKVKKVPLTTQESLDVVRGWYGTAPEGIEEEVKKILEFRYNSTMYVKNLIKSRPEAASFFGNPSFQEDGTIIQDKVTVAADWFEQLDDGDRRSFLVDAADAIKTGWDYGVHETSFNILNNYGVDSSGKVVLIDFGEVITDDVALIGRELGREAWKRSFDFRNGLSDEEQEFYAETAVQALTQDSLSRHWRKALK